MITNNPYSRSSIVLPVLKNNDGTSLLSFHHVPDHYEPTTMEVTTVSFMGRKSSEDIRSIRNILFKQYLRGQINFKDMMREALDPDIDPRIKFLQALEANQGVSLTYAGTSPSHNNFRGVFSDIDLATNSKLQYEGILDAAREQGYQLEEKSLYTEIPTLDFLVWKPLEIVSEIDTLDPAVYDDQVVFIVGQAPHKYSQLLGYMEKAIPALQEPDDMGEGAMLYSRMITGYKSVLKSMSLLGLEEVAVGQNPISGEHQITRKELEDIVTMHIPPEDFGLYVAGKDPRRVESIIAHQEVLFKLLRAFNSAMFVEINRAPLKAAHDLASRKIKALIKQKNAGSIDKTEYTKRKKQIWDEHREIERKIKGVTQRERIRLRAMWEKYPRSIMRQFYFPQEVKDQHEIGFDDYKYWQFRVASS